VDEKALEFKMVINPQMIEPIQSCTHIEAHERLKLKRVKVKGETLQGHQKTRWEQESNSSREGLPRDVMRHARALRCLMIELFPQRRPPDPRAVASLMWEAYKAEDDNYGEEEALRWAEGFRFESNLGDRDAALLRAVDGDLCHMVKIKHEIISAQGRLSEE
jgi:hypothetical protein